MIDDREPIQWGGENEEDFDKRYDHDWVGNDYTDHHHCGSCGMPYAKWDGFPCTAKAEHISYWVPRNQNPAV